MKPTTTLALMALAGSAAFLTGRWNAAASVRLDRGARVLNVHPAADRPFSKREARPGVEEAPVDPLASCERISADKVVMLSSEERMALLADGALVYNSANQAAVLCGVISALTREEIQEAANILGGIQDHGNGITQEVWDSLYFQWGKIDPVACLSHLGKDAVAKSPADARHAMAGWLETDPGAALAWATEPKHAPLDAAAAAYAITNSAGGDLKRLESAMRKLPEDCLTTQACLEDYFDLASLAGEGRSAPEIFNELAPSLRAAAWPVTMKRLAYAEPTEAAAWLEKHANDPGAITR